MTGCGKLAGVGPVSIGRCGESIPGGFVFCDTCVAVAVAFGQAEVQKSVPAAPAAELAILRDHRRVYIEYARHRIDDGDWHGVSDAANDLRELDVEIRMLEAAKL